MNKTIKTGIFAMSALMVLGVAACGGKAVDDANTLEIYCLDAGYKTEWLNKMKDAFQEQDWVKEKYPNLKISVVTNDEQDFASKKLDAGKSGNSYDLMFGINLEAYNGTSDILDITQKVYKQKVPGETVTFESKMQDSFLKGFKYNDAASQGKEPKYFLAPWAGGNMGIIYNENFLFAKDSGGQYKYTDHVPNTTDELVEVAEKYTLANYSEKSTITYAFLQSVNDDYFNTLFRDWWGQYNGIDGYLNFYNGIDDGIHSRNIFKQQGRLKALEVLEELLINENHYLSPRSKLDDFMVSQTSFLRGGALFNVNGDWFPSEMKTIRDEIIAKDPSLNYTFKMMKTPIMSSIIETCDSIEDDAELSALITAIDKESTSLTGEGYSVSQDDYDHIKEARTVVYSLGPCHAGVIPSYAVAQDVACDFLLFMATDKAQDTYIEATYGSSLPFKYNLIEKNPTLYNSDKVDALHKERISYMNNSFNPGYTLPNHYSFPLRKWGYVEATYGDVNYYANFIKDTSHTTPQKYYDMTIEHWTEANWENALSAAGLK